jgi:NAD(P)H-dependent flavin oxidoreductase YrpB (nitropropane dioxygenase family)
MMKSRICEMFGIEAPILAFSHCRDVVVEVSKAGGLGVLGMSRVNATQLKEELKWIDDHINGKPYGIDALMPSTYKDVGEQKLDIDHLLPKEQVDFVHDLMDKAGVPRHSESEARELMQAVVDEYNFTPKESAKVIDVALDHPIKLIVNGLGSPPKEIVERAHAKGIKVAALAGIAKHAVRHKQAGCDFVVAVGTEAAGHTGNITSMVLWPQIVDAVAPLPVIGAGGVGRGRQLAAALALGCEGVWCGSIWLKTVQSEVIPEIKEKLFAAESDQAVLTKAVSGKQIRSLRSKYIDAWNEPGAPKLLPAPLQLYLTLGNGMWGRGKTRLAKDLLTYPVGQIVGDMNEETSVKQVFYDMLTELLETKERFDRIMS